tara:strand:- start:494 stop:1072 length:579 start_codon:yes stop_codon:yes gene_type:complete
LQKELKMSNSKISYTSVGQAISEAVAKYKKNESIEDCLLWINEDEDRLTEWAYETFLYDGIDDYVFLTTEDELFITDDNLLEYFDAKELDLTEDSEIDDFIFQRTQELFMGDSHAAHFYYQDEVYLTAFCSMWGAAGPHFSGFNIYRSKEEYFAYLKNQGYILPYESDTGADLISMFRKNVTDKYFRGDSSS